MAEKVKQDPVTDSPWAGASIRARHTAQADDPPLCHANDPQIPVSGLPPAAFPGHGPLAAKSQPRDCSHGQTRTHIPSLGAGRAGEAVRRRGDDQELEAQGGCRWHRYNREGTQGRDKSGGTCTSPERAGGGEDEPDNHCLESLTRVPSKIMAQILRKGAL